MDEIVRRNGRPENGRRASQYLEDLKRSAQGTFSQDVGRVTEQG